MRKTKLMITLRMGESVVIGDDIVITPSKKSSNSISLAFYAPENVAISRQKVIEQQVGIRPVAEFLSNPRKADK
jgi:carbon storage regulator CsrA